MKITEKLFDIETQKEEVITRDATKDELAAYKKAEAEFAALAKIDAEKKAARDLVLAKLGLTPEEADALIG